MSYSNQERGINGINNCLLQRCCNIDFQWITEMMKGNKMEYQLKIISERNGIVHDESCDSIEMVDDMIRDFLNACIPFLIPSYTINVYELRPIIDEMRLIDYMNVKEATLEKLQDAGNVHTNPLIELDCMKEAMQESAIHMDKKCTCSSCNHASTILGRYEIRDDDFIPFPLINNLNSTL